MSADHNSSRNTSTQHIASDVYDANIKPRSASMGCHYLIDQSNSTTTISKQHKPVKSITPTGDFRTGCPLFLFPGIFHFNLNHTVDVSRVAELNLKNGTD